MHVFFLQFPVPIAKRIKKTIPDKMPEPSSPASTPKWVIVLFLLVFIGSAAWGGYVLAKNAHLRQRGQPTDPIENQTLFGR